jgi:hypothetical protein
MRKLFAATAIGLFSLAIWASAAPTRDVPPRVAVENACTRINANAPFCLTR